MTKVLCLTVLAWSLAGSTAVPGQPRDLLLFDFEKAADLKGWTNLELASARVKEPAVLVIYEPK